MTEKSRVHLGGAREPPRNAIRATSAAQAPVPALAGPRPAPPVDAPTEILHDEARDRDQPFGTSLAPGRSLRMLSFNIHVGIAANNLAHYLSGTWKHLLPFRGRMANLDRIGDFISGFDIVGLQEVDAGSLRSNFVDLPKRLSERAGFEHRYTRINRDLGYARHAMALLSRVEPMDVILHRLPGAIPGRGAIEASYALSTGGTLGVFLLHLALSARAREAQLRYLSTSVQAHQQAVIMGDFNCEPGSSEFCRFLERTGVESALTPVPTYPSWAPRQALDHILLTPGLAVTTHRVYPLRFSDHLPMGVEIRLLDPLAS